MASNPAYAVSLTGPVHAGRLDAATDAELPGDVADLLRQRGVAGGAVLLLSDGESAALTSGGDFSAVALVLEDARTQELERILTKIAPLLRPDTTLVATLPASREADPNSIHLLLLRSGYDRVWIHSRRRTLRISAKRGAAAQAPRTCSIIVPVYNEKSTFPELMRLLLAKRLDHLGLEREIILVESNSTDGTRDLVAGFAGTPGVRIIWQERPRGKGHAVRAGLAVATGDILLIQDADLEYDLDDYEALLEPLLAGHAAFVLGARHGGRLRMRKFAEQKLLGETLNVAHVLLAGFINVLYGQSMKDPFTMFKVFRRECLYGLQFECNKFDFDHELVIKLVLKGYRPLEIPVNYRARSFSQGKKISFLRDPPGLLAADLKYRCGLCALDSIDGHRELDDRTTDRSPRRYCGARLLAQVTAIQLFRGAELQRAIASLGLTPGMRVLDAGCGTGEALQWLSDAVAPRGSVVGIDLAVAHVAAANAGVRNQANSPGRIEVLQGDVMNPPLAPVSFDLVWSVNTINHLREPLAGIRVLTSLLRPGGRIAVGQSSLLPEMFFAWDSRLERLTNEAVRQYYRDRYSLSERDLADTRSLVGLLRRAALNQVRAQTFVIERVSPVNAADEAYLLEAIFMSTWGEHLRPYLAAEDYAEVCALCDPQLPASHYVAPTSTFCRPSRWLSGR